MKYFEDTYLQHLTESDKPYYLQEAVNPQDKMIYYFTNAIKAQQLQNYKSLIAILLELDKDTIITIFRIKDTDNFSNTTSRYRDSNSSIKSLKVLLPQIGKEVWSVPNAKEPVLFYDDKIHDILIKSGWTYSDKNMNKEDWLYAGGTVEKNWGKNWGSEVMASISTALDTKGNMSWWGTGKS
jgi:hypothetical protein